MLPSTQSNVFAMTRICPDRAAPLATFIAASTDPGYACPIHGKFVVTRSSEQFGFWEAPIAAQRRVLKSARDVAPGERIPVAILYA